MPDQEYKDQHQRPRWELLDPPGSPRSRMLALTAAGCSFQWEPGLSHSGDGTYNDSAYLHWLLAEEICAKWGFTYEECRRAWMDFLDRHKGRYPGGNWQPVEKAYLDSLENVEDSHAK